VIVVVDCGISNVRSVVNMVRRAGGTVDSTDSPERVRAATKVILPGVGSFDRAMTNLHERGLAEALTEVASRAVPMLGLCLGMQLMTRRSDEGEQRGFGWLAAETRRFHLDPSAGLKVPHMGWNHVEPAKPDPVTQALPSDARFYFVHSYFVACDDPSDVLLWTSHGSRFAAAFRRGNLWGMQFHPEKSHTFGLALMRGFVELPN